jgi:hypothetical protein
MSGVVSGVEVVGAVVSGTVVLLPPPPPQEINVNRVKVVIAIRGHGSLITEIPLLMGLILVIFLHSYGILVLHVNN